jgi:hypothetical protein
VSVSESQRHQVFHWFEEAMGPERAAAMMDMLPPVGWADLATKDDVRTSGIELRGEMAELRGELRELRGEMHEGFARLQRTTYLSLLASNATVAGLVLAAVRLG